MKNLMEVMMSHRDAEELAAEIAYMQDDPSFRPKKDPLNEPDSPEASIERLEFKNKKLHQYDTGHGVPRVETIKETIAWLDRQLGPVE